MSGNHRLCPASHAGVLDHPIRRLLQSPSRLLGPFIRPGDTVLDIGAGSGFFTRPMARMVGEKGLVIAVDLQEEMLAMLRERAKNEGVISRIRVHRALPGTLDLSGKGIADFALAFYVVHEMPDAARFFAEVAVLLRPGGKMLVVEPTFEVGAAEFAGMLQTAMAAGFTAGKGPRVLFGRTAVLEKRG
ncbi:MAG: methyltransferase domain-containing protein [Methanomicrobiales archaeon]|nr:methyltransferase domain-containing protein [Methanomicrobiales archaeon]